MRSSTATANYARLCHADYDLIDSELVWYPFVAPTSSMMVHARFMMLARLLRPTGTRGREQEGGDGHIGPRLQHNLDKLLEWFTGDRRQHRCVYYQVHKNTVCDRSRVVANMTRAFQDAFLERLASCTPSMSRWYTVEPSIAQICGGCLCHNILGRAFERAFSRELAEDMDGIDDEGASWTQMITAGLHKAVDFLLNPSNAEHMVLSLVATEPIDALSQRLQHLDAHSSCLRDLVDETKGPLAKTQVADRQ